MNIHQNNTFASSSSSDYCSYHNSLLFGDYLNKEQELCSMNVKKIRACEFLIRFHELRGDKRIVNADSLYVLPQYAIDVLHKPEIIYCAESARARDSDETHLPLPSTQNSPRCVGALSVALVSIPMSLGSDEGSILTQSPTRMKSTQALTRFQSHLITQHQLISLLLLISKQDYALCEVIKNGNSWVPIPVTATETGLSTRLKMIVPSTVEEKIYKKNDVKARSLLLMALPNEHQLTFDQYVDAQSMFAAIKARFGGNEATKKTQKALLKQQYENFNASSSESLDSIFNRLQKLVSRLAILGVVTPPEDLNVKFLRSLPSEWDTHVVVWMNKPDFDTMGLDDLYNNFKIVEQKVKRSAGANNDDKNLAFLTTSGASSTNNINTVNPEVSTGTTKVNTASTETSTASFSDATVYAFLSTQPQGSQLVHEDLEQLHDDDLEEMDLKWNMALLSMRARKFYQRTGRKIIIDGSSTAGYDKSKVECFNCHKMGHFARECRAPRSKDNRNWNQGSSSKAVRIEDASEKAMCAIDGAGFDWSDMAEEEIQANMALMAFSDSESFVPDAVCRKDFYKKFTTPKGIVPTHCSNRIGKTMRVVIVSLGE
ncbi:ribonuclease H-like domain-containing protein [Tanacetum coccineum]